MNSSIATAPLLEGHDAIAAAVATTPDTASRLVAAQTAYAASVENAHQARERTDWAAASHRQAEADKKALIDKASAGAEVDQTDISRARIAVADARDALDHARLVATGAVTLRDKAYIVALAAEAGHLTASYDAKVQRQISKAEAIDAAYAAVQATIADHDDAEYDTRVAANLLRQHNQTVIAAVASNKQLAALHPSEHPKAQPPSDVAVPPTRVAYITDRWGDVDVDPIESVAGRLRSAHGIVDEAPVPPADEPWLVRQARLKAEAEKMTGGGPTTFNPTKMGR